MTDLAPLAWVFASAFGIGLSGAMMPGPLLAVTVDETTRRGAHAGPLIVAGHALLEAALVAAIALGLGRFLTHPVVMALISFAGAAVMLWMGQDMLRAAPTLSLRATPAPTARRLHPVAAGIVVSLSNPYWTLWWATIGITYVVLGQRFGLAGLIVFFAGHILSDLAWYGLVSVTVARGRRFLSDRAYRAIITACALILLGFGIWFVAYGIHQIRVT